MSAWLASPRKRGTAGDSLYALYLLNCWLRMRK